MRSNKTERAFLVEPFFKDPASAEVLVSLCPDAIIGIDRKGTVCLLNPAAERLMGRSVKETVGRLNITGVYPSEEIAREIKRRMYAEEAGGRGRLEDFETTIVHENGREIPIRLSATLVFRDGVEIGSVGFFHNLSVRKVMEERLRALSITDGLTGLYNQRHFHNCLFAELSRIDRYRRPLSLICFDLDHFKNCNDTLGHQEGDNILRLIGEVLRKETRKSDSCFRYGGDEFFIMLPETETESARKAAEKIREAFKHKWPFDPRSQRCSRVTLSMGVASATYGEQPEGIIKRADLAMYEAKRQGGDRVVASEPPSTDHSENP
jgi:diguanylate cyclase (GGDEF)-like protein/PAS domain S-box-containing protein